MQNLFNKKKRPHDGSGSGGPSSKHSKSSGNGTSRSPNFLGTFNGTSENPKPDPTKAQKIANLIRSLDDVLDEDGLDATVSLIGEETTNRCMDLRTSLSKHKPMHDPIPTPSASQLSFQQLSMSHDFRNAAPSSISPLSISAWKSSTIPTSLPALPEILDPTLEAAAFIHVSCGNGKVTDLTYERLEWVGDIYLELTATLLIAQTFQSHSPGQASHLRERLVKNITLARYAREYGFDKRARLSDKYLETTKMTERDWTKIHGDIFEAYTAAVILSDPVNGVARAVEWLKDLWGQELQKEIIQEERNSFKLDNPMWRLRGKVARPEDIKPTDDSQKAPPNSKDVLQKLIGAKGIKLRYEDIGAPKKDPNTKLALFTVGVYLDGWGETNKCLGTGKANGKKEAGFRAAEMAMQNQKMMKLFIERKKLADAQLEMEIEAMQMRKDA